MTRRTLLAAAAVAPFTQPAPTEIWGGLVRNVKMPVPSVEANFFMHGHGSANSWLLYDERTKRTWRGERVNGEWTEWEETQ